MMSLEKILRSHQKVGSLISIYSNAADWGKFSFGRVIYLSEQIVVILSYTRLGERSGYEIRPLRDVCKIELGGKYEQHLSEIIEREKSEESGPALQISDKLGTMASVLLEAQTANAIVSVWGGDDNQPISGYASKVGEDTYCIDMLNQYGESDGVAYGIVSDITAIDYETRDLKLLRKFSETKVKKPS